MQKKEIRLKVNIMFEPNRTKDIYLANAYEMLMSPIKGVIKKPEDNGVFANRKIFSNKQKETQI